MAKFCSSCGTKLGLARRFVGGGLCNPCTTRSENERKAREAAEKTARDDARIRYIQMVASIGEGSTDPAILLPQLAPLRDAAQFPSEDLASLNRQAVRVFVERALVDDVLTEEEELEFDRVITELGVPPADLASPELRDLLFRLMIAQVNAGRMPVINDANIVLKKAELLHFEASAQLLKEVTIREYQAGSRGMSFRVMKGVYYRTGSTRGRSVVVGTELQIADTGMLYVTSQRSVFVGSRQTIEMPHSKLVTLNVFSNAVQFHMSNRKNAPLFQLETGDVVAAMVNAAASNAP